MSRRGDEDPARGSLNIADGYRGNGMGDDSKKALLDGDGGYQRSGSSDQGPRGYGQKGGSGKGGVIAANNRPKERCLCCSVELGNVLLLGISFFFMFTAYNTLQNFVTTVNKDAGFYSLATLYVVFSISNFFAPAVVKGLGFKISLVGGMLTYCAFIASNIKVITWVLVAAAGLEGLGAAILWTAQGAFLMSNTNDDNMGLYSGIFWLLFQFSQIVGNLGAALLVSAGVDIHTVFLILLIVGSIGVVVTFFLRNAGRPKPKEEALQPGEKRVPALLATVYLLKEPSVLLLLPVMVYSGCSQTYFFGVFPPELGTSHIGYVMAVLGGCDAIGSFGLGRLSDRIGRLPVFTFGMLCNWGGCVLAYLTTQGHFGTVVYYFAAGLMGLSDASFNTQIYSVLGYFFPARREAAFSTFKLMQALSTAIGFFFANKLTFFVNSVIMVSTCFVGVTCVYICNFAVRKIAPPARGSVAGDLRIDLNADA